MWIKILTGKSIWEQKGNTSYMVCDLVPQDPYSFQHRDLSTVFP